MTGKTVEKGCVEITNLQCGWSFQLQTSRRNGPECETTERWVVKSPSNGSFPVRSVIRPTFKRSSSLFYVTNPIEKRKTHHTSPTF